MNSVYILYEYIGEKRTIHSIHKTEDSADYEEVLEWRSGNNNVFKIEKHDLVDNYDYQ